MDDIGDATSERTAAIDAGEVRAELARILADSSFAAAPQRSRLLRQLVESALDGSAREVKEYTLGVEFFGRGAAFDPKIDNIVRSHVHRLRQRLEGYFAGPGRSDPVLIEIPKGHYVARFRRRPASTPPTSLADRTKQRRFGVYAGVVGLVGAAFAVWLLHDRVLDTLNPTADLGTIEIPTFDASIDDADATLFAKGLVDSLERYSAINGVKVAARDPGNQRAEFTLLGSLERDREQYVVTAKLVHRGAARTLWSTILRRDVHESSEFQEQFSIWVASILKCVQRDRGYAADDVSPDVLSKFFLWCENQIGNRYAEQPALAQQIVGAAPQYAISHAMCAGANSLMTLVAYDSSTPQELERMRKLVYACADAALARDPRIGSPYVALASVHDPARGLVEREALFQKSLSVEPQFIYARNFYAIFLSHVGRKSEARVYFDRYANDEPLLAGGRLQRARGAMEAGDMAAARILYAQASAMMVGALPVKLEWAMAEHWSGDPELAAQLVDREQRERWTENGMWDCFRSVLDARAQHVRLTEADIEAACAAGFHVPADQVFAYFGHVDAALRAIEARLESMKSAGPFAGGWVSLFTPQMRSVRVDPRFMVLAARLGLIDYWIETNQWPDFCSTEQLRYDCAEAARAVPTT